MGTWFSIMNVQNDNGNDNRESHKNHCEEEIFSEQGQRQRCRGNDFRNQQEKHCLRKKDVDAESDLLPRVRWEIERKHRKVRDADAGNN